MKKITTISIVLFLTCALSGCLKKTESSSSNERTGATTSPEEQPVPEPQFITILATADQVKSEADYNRLNKEAEFRLNQRITAASMEYNQAIDNMMDELRKSIRGAKNTLKESDPATFHKYAEYSFLVDNESLTKMDQSGIPSLVEYNKVISICYKIVDSQRKSAEAKRQKITKSANEVNKQEVDSIEKLYQQVKAAQSSLDIPHL
ncbi:MAG TPA: hypothetical protein VHQ41_03875 [Patescibacteria group bacterium]|jgi:hypothetical protein|nr:hypothetical protein [Patescibacteria group bacterium]